MERTDTCCGQGKKRLKRNKQGSSQRAAVQYVVEIDGKQYSEHIYFVDAIKVGPLLREQYPESKIKIRDLSVSESEEVRSELAA